MCGIVGIVSKHNNGFSYPESEMFTNMLFLDTLRGWHGTGVFGADSWGNVGMHKAAIPGTEFIWTPEYKDFQDKVHKDGAFVVGHNRAATRGTISDENSHPFIVDDKIILCQNGTWRGDHKHIKDVEVDSHAIAHLLSEEDDVVKALKKVNAAYTLVWYNADKHELNLIRNTERPLFIAEFQHAGMMFASEKETLQFAASKCQTPPKFKKEPYQLEPHTLMKVVFDGKGSTITQEKLPLTPPIVVQVPRTYNNHWVDGRGRDDIENVSDVRQLSHYRAPPTEQPSDIRTTVTEYLMLRGEEHWFNTAKAAEEASNKLKAHIADAAAVHTKSFYTLLDCIPCNSHPQCSSFFMLGALLSTVAAEPSALVYFALRDTTQDDAITAACGYAECDVTTVITSMFQNSTGQHWLVTAYGFNPTLIKGQ